MQPNAICEQCGRGYHTPPSTAGRRRFCSHVCAYTSFHEHGWAKAKPKVAVTCATCGKVREVNPQRAETMRYCSQACMIAQRTPKQKMPRETRWCVVCGAPFSRLPSQMRDGRGRCCSRKCVGIYVTIHGARVSGPERRCLDALEAAGVKVLRSVPLCGFVVDGYVPAWNQVIEIDGDYWHSLPAMAARDRRKDAALRAAGYRISRVRVGKTEMPWDRLASVMCRVHAGQGTGYTKGETDAA